jgi:hypothetical protein
VHTTVLERAELFALGLRDARRRVPRASIANRQLERPPDSRPRTGRPRPTRTTANGAFSANSNEHDAQVGAKARHDAVVAKVVNSLTPPPPPPP